MKGLIVGVLTDKEIGDCTNGGISSKVNHAVLTGDGIPEIFEPREDMPEFKLVKRNIYGRIYIHCEPIKPVNPHNIGYMAGGNFAYSSDSRFHNICDYPISIHDRQETQQAYDALTR